ncbi:Cytochrome C oxidase, cbb3-type, subunit III [Oceanospirillum multiglobuliferum]|nr:Cytochrome C oxidase, cbb3-type, subunit III [Oceanospirillum multiglobuliferum]
MATGKDMYQDYCAGCHRPSGVGKFFLGIPASISAELSRADTVRLIREGDPRYPRMPVFPQIKFSQAQKIYDHLEDLRERHMLNQ